MVRNEVKSSHESKREKTERKTENEGLDRKTNRKNYERPGIVVRGGDLHSRGRGFESQHRILDGHFHTILL